MDCNNLLSCLNANKDEKKKPNSPNTGDNQSDAKTEAIGGGKYEGELYQITEQVANGALKKDDFVFIESILDTDVVAVFQLGEKECKEIQPNGITESDLKNKTKKVNIAKKVLFQVKNIAKEVEERQYANITNVVINPKRRIGGGTVEIQIFGVGKLSEHTVYEFLHDLEAKELFSAQKGELITAKEDIHGKKDAYFIKKGHVFKVVYVAIISGASSQGGPMNKSYRYKITLAGKADEYTGTKFDGKPAEEGLGHVLWLNDMQFFEKNEN